MLKALYYPHTDIQSPVIVKNALLLWDSIETIVPHANWKRKGPTGDRSNWQMSGSNKDKLMREAIEIVVRPRVPNAAERQIAHKKLSEIVKSGLASSLVLRSPQRWRRPEYLIYPEKFLHETWHLLQTEGMARWEEFETDYRVPAGLR